jgi:hypothetical protein
MLTPLNLANHILNIEQKLIAYQTLHENELAELWKALNDCKRLIVATHNNEDEIIVPVDQVEERQP